ncbi:MAG: DUF547 domain-containing protein [Deltaproteobacteria bacterium]|nr:DUF547 domain-containing protein [Deltaproteobacteria bacterium]
MRLSIQFAVTILTILLMTNGHTLAAQAADFDHSKFDRILKTYVDNQGRVDYNGIAGDNTFHEYMKSLENAKVDSLSQDGQLAFWINAYNAVTIDKVIKWKPKKSVRETLIPGVWTGTKFFTSRQHTVAAQSVSQDDIEHEILRKRFQDPRIHFAIICASSGCPLLPQFAYTAENVQMKLEEETRQYLNSERGLRIDYMKNTIQLSKLFDWFAGDFESKSGSVINFIKPYLDEKAMAFLDRNPKKSYLEYDWALNAKEPLK